MNNLYHRRQCLIVLGMHRSGTSALAGSLNHLGIPMGKQLIHGHNDNTTGFWESPAIVDFHERLLKQLHSSWFDPRPLPDNWWISDSVELHINEICLIIQDNFSVDLIWALKDPRMCRLLPLWFEALARLKIEPLFLCSLRNPMEVTASLCTRNNFTKEQSLLLWLQYNLNILEYTTGYKRKFINYNQLLKEGNSQLINILNDWGIDICDYNEDSTSRTKFLDESLRHHTLNDKYLKDDSTLSNLVNRLYKYLMQQCTTTSEPDWKDWQYIKAQHLQYIDFFNNWIQLTTNLQKTLINTNKTLKTLNNKTLGAHKKNTKLEMKNQQLKIQLRKSELQVNDLDRALQKTQNIASQNTPKIHTLNIALQEAQQIVTERNIQIEQLEIAYGNATKYVREREADIAVLTQHISGLSRKPKLIFKILKFSVNTIRTIKQKLCII